MDQRDPFSIRWRIASSVGPEAVALALVVVLAISILLVVRLGSSHGDVDVSHPSPAPSAALSRSLGPSAREGLTGGSALLRRTGPRLDAPSAVPLGRQSVESLAGAASRSDPN
jgi:hypothetical protein